jgi:hypothetical protein
MSQSATDTTRELGVVLARRSLDNPWIDHVWVAQTVLYPAPEVAPGALLSQEAVLTLVYAGPATVELFVSETGNYRDNLLSGAPSLWVAARSRSDGGTPEFVRVTADPTEGEAYFESGSDIVAALPMPEELNSWISAFVDAWHVERVFLKRKRDGKGGKQRGQAGGGGA